MPDGLFSFIRNQTNEKLNLSTWKTFKVSDLFKVECSKYHNPKDYEDGDVPYVARTTFNNGEIKRVSTTEKLYPANCITIGAESARAFYQEKPFITGNKTYRIYATEKSKLNKYIALFICTLLNKEGEKYDYVNAFVSEKIENTLIPLPTKNNEPDWDYMEKYVKDIYIHTKKLLI